MPLIETKGAASAQGFGLTLSSGAVTYIEDVFSTYLYTGNGSTQTITNGIDLSTKGGLVWLKGRSGATDHALYDTTRGATKDLVSNSTAAETTQSTGLTSFASTGFSIGALAKINTNAATYASWTFRKQPKFFDVVTYTGNGTATNVISHALGSTPGVVMVKATSTTSAWFVTARKANDSYAVGLSLNTTGASVTTYNLNQSGLTATTFNAGNIYEASGNFTPNDSGVSYVAYLFAHDAGGFGLSGSDNVISCGSYTGGSGAITVNLGWEPQWILRKNINATNYWEIVDVMRGMPVASNPFNSIAQTLFPNVADAESAFAYIYPNSTGFVDANSSSSQTFIYIAIRRGPMKVPTSGTSVFGISNYVGNGTSGRQLSTGITATDLSINKPRNAVTNFSNFYDRLRGATKALRATSTAAETTISDALTGFDRQTQLVFGADLGDSGVNNVSGDVIVGYFFRRSPSFFDVVCYTGTGSATTFNHNLGVAPELVIVKWRAGATGENWAVMCTAASSSPDRRFLYLDLNAAGGGLNGKFADSSGTPVLPTATQVYIGTNDIVNKSAATYVAYLFATCAGVSKVGSYTGTGALQTVNCGFTGGARFVLIKRTDSTGDWYVYDSARGISSGNDPYLFLNSTAAEVTGTNYVDTTSVGFQVTAAAPAGLNANGGTYIFLAIA